MPITPAAVERFLAELNAARPVTHRKMFGGVGIYADGVFFAVIDDDRLYFKVDEGNEAAYLAEDAEPWVIQGETPQIMPYREVPERVRTDPAILMEWIDASVAVATRKKSKSRKKALRQE